MLKPNTWVRLRTGCDLHPDKSAGRPLRERREFIGLFLGPGLVHWLPGAGLPAVQPYHWGEAGECLEPLDVPV